MDTFPLVEGPERISPGFVALEQPWINESLGESRNEGKRLDGQFFSCKLICTGTVRDVRHINHS